MVNPDKGSLKYYVSMFCGGFSNPSIHLLSVSKNGQFLNPPTQSSADMYVIFEWSLSDHANNDCPDKNYVLYFFEHIIRLSK